MWISSLKLVRQAALAALLFSLPVWAGAAESAAPPADVQPAAWTPKELTFVFQGFTAHYSCDGLLDKIRHVLGELGARDDLKVNYYGCSSGFGRPDPFQAYRSRCTCCSRQARATRART